MGKGVRFGIMCEGTTFPRWQANAIIQLLKLNNVSCELLIINKNIALTSKFEHYFLRLKSINKLFWTVYYQLCKKRFKQTELVDLQKELKDTCNIRASTKRKGKFSEYFQKKDIDFIKEKELDFILRFSFGIIRGEILNVAKYGIWSFHHGDEENYRGGPPGFWEIYNKNNITGFILQRLTDKLDGGVVLKKGYVKTNLSYVKNRDQIYYESSKFVSSLCIDIINNNVDDLNKKPSETKSPIYLAPNNFQFISFIVNNWINKMKSLNRFFYVDFWNIGVVEQPISSFLTSGEKPTVKWLPLKNKKQFIADPFGVEGKNGLDIFYESYKYKNKGSKGVIDTVSYNNGFFDDKIKNVLRKSTHLSYPQIIERKKEYFMLPENYESNSITLYPLDLKNKIVFDKIKLIEGFSGVDNTIVFYNDIYWMFTGEKNDSPHHNLFLFYSETLEYGWKSHPKNPVKTDVRSSRNAGTPFIYNKELYRPSMDYSEKCEGRISINKIITLTKNEFKEDVVKVVNPYLNSSYPDKIHTISSVGGYTLIDGAKELLIFENWNIFKYRAVKVFGQIKEKLF